MGLACLPRHRGPRLTSDHHHASCRFPGVLTPSTRASCQPSPNLAYIPSLTMPTSPDLAHRSPSPTGMPEPSRLSPSLPAHLPLPEPRSSALAAPKALAPPTPPPTIAPGGAPVAWPGFCCPAKHTGHSSSKAERRPRALRASLCLSGGLGPRGLWPLPTHPQQPCMMHTCHARAPMRHPH